jgi:hypothetical protein
MGSPVVLFDWCKLVKRKNGGGERFTSSLSLEKHVNHETKSINETIIHDRLHMTYKEGKRTLQNMIFLTTLLLSFIVLFFFCMICIWFVLCCCCLNTYDKFMKQLIAFEILFFHILFIDTLSIRFYVICCLCQLSSYDLNLM